MITSIQFVIHIQQTALMRDEDVLSLQHRLTESAQNLSGGEVAVSITAYEGELDKPTS